jgi:predicted nucleic acid-binding protein
MDTIADTGFAYAVVYPKDDAHRLASAFYLASEDRILFPAVALPELAFLAHRAGRNPAVAAALRAVRSSRMVVTDLVPEDYDRAASILEKYHDSRIDFVDACIMALAERLRITRILTFDRRDFGLYRPEHCEHFELLP